MKKKKICPQFEESKSPKAGLTHPDNADELKPCCVDMLS